MGSLLLIGVLHLVALTLVAANSIESLTDYKLYRVDIDTTEQLDSFQKLGNNFPLYYLHNLEGPGRSYDIVIEPGNQNSLEHLLERLNLRYQLWIEDLQRVLDDQKVNDGTSELEWTTYHQLKDIYAWAEALPQRHKNVRTITIGYSYEQRPIKAVEIRARSASKKIIFVEANIHAIERIGSAAGSCFINNLLTTKNKTLASLLNYNWVFVPVVNPDGLWYIQNVSPLWRKNRRPNGYRNDSGPCYGVDMNRNFNYKFRVAGYNLDVPCDHWYAGASPASEPEVQTIQRYVTSLGKNVAIYLALHSYGNFLLLPYGHTNEIVPPNFAEMQTISEAFSKEAQKVQGTLYTHGASGQLNYPVSGAAKDWAYAVRGIPYAATVELGSNEDGFFLPAAKIQGICDELTRGLVGLVKAAERAGIFKRNR